MGRFGVRAGLILSAALLAALLSSGGTLAQTGAQPGAQTGAQQQAPGGAAAEGKTAGETFKNVQVLKDIPAAQLIPTMQFVATSLGVQCSFCHVQGANDSDDKQTKQTARKMMQMVMAINKDNFNGRMQITCYTCHRGSQDPVSVPPVMGQGGPAPAPQQEAAASGSQPPPADQLLAKYLQFMGGADALAKITTRVEKGTATSSTGQSSPVEIYVEAPDARVMITHGANGDRTVGYKDKAALGGGGRGGPPSDPQAMKLEDDLYLATNVKQLYSTWRVGRPDKVGDRDAYVLNGMAQGYPAIRLYLDAQSGMLLRLVHFTETGLGRMPTQVDYADYRAVDGVQVPFRITTSTPSAQNTVQLDQVQQNVPVDDSKFAAPASAPAAR